MAKFTKEQVVEAIKTVYDPEIPVNIYDLGLIYDVDVDEESSEVSVVMTLTSPACPSAREIPAMIEQRVTSTLDTDKCMVHVVWSPQWGPHLITEEGRKILGIEEVPPAPPGSAPAS